MKKIFGVILVFSIIILSLFAGCTDKEKDIAVQNDYIDYSTDMQIMYHAAGAVAPMTKSDTGYYYIGDDNIIIYVDKETQRATPLCAKPDCMHTDPQTCDAYINLSNYITIDSLFGSLGTPIQYYDGSLYAVCGEYDKSYIEYNTYLMKMDADGSNRVQLTDYFDFSFKDWFIHRGYFYYTSDSSILRIPLDAPKSEPETVYRAKHYIEEDQNTFSFICAYKNNIYFEVDEMDEEGNGDGRQSICINLDTTEKSNLETNGNVAHFNAFAGDSMLVTHVDENDIKYFMKSDLYGQNQKLILTQTVGSVETVSSDGRYYYFNNVLQAAADKSVEQVITVRDENLNEVDSFKLPKMDTIVYNFFTPQDESFFLFEYYNEEDEHLLVMADKSQIGSIGGGTIEYTELCKLKWTEETEHNYVKAE